MQDKTNTEYASVSKTESTKKSSDESQVGAILEQWMERYGQASTEDTENALKTSENIKSQNDQRLKDCVAEAVPHADIMIVTSDGGTIKAHKLILALRSEVFSVMFMTEMSESINSEVHIVDFYPFAVNAFVDYFYSDSIGVANLALCSDLYAMARKYQVAGLEELCEERILHLLSPATVLDVLALGDFHSGERLRAAALRFITLSGPQLVTTPVFMDKLRQYMDGIHDTTPRDRLPRATSTSSVELAPALSPLLVSPMNEHLRQLLQALAGVSVMGGAADVPVQTPGGCLCHTCKIHRSTAATFLAHATLPGQAGSPQAASVGVPPLLFDSPLSYDESSSLSNSAGKTAAANTSSSNELNGHEAQVDVEKLSRSGSDRHLDFDVADAKRRRTASL